MIFVSYKTDSLLGVKSLFEDKMTRQSKQEPIEQAREEEDDSIRKKVGNEERVERYREYLMKHIMKKRGMGEGSQRKDAKNKNKKYEFSNFNNGNTN